MFELAFFNNGVTIASLYTSGKTPESNESLIMVVMNGKMSLIKSRTMSLAKDQGYKSYVPIF